jgi:hypothetical protein
VTFVRLPEDVNANESVPVSVLPLTAPTHRQSFTVVVPPAIEKTVFVFSPPPTGV